MALPASAQFAFPHCTKPEVSPWFATAKNCLPTGFSALFKGNSDARKEGLVTGGGL